MSRRRLVPRRLALAPPKRSREPLSVRVPEAMRLLGIGRTKFYELVAAGEIEIVKLGKATLIPVRSLEALIERHSAVRANETGKRRRGRPRISFTQLRG